MDCNLMLLPLLMLMTRKEILVSGSIGQMAVIQGEDFGMSCFSGSTNIIIGEVKYLSSEPSSEEQTIAHYKPDSESGTGSLQVLSTATQFRGRLRLETDNSITITGILVSDEGRYTCAETAFGQEDTTVANDLVVYVRPKVEVYSVPSLRASNAPTNAGYCKAVNAKPDAMVYWRMDKNLEYEQKRISDKGDLPKTTTNTSTLYVAPTKYYNKLSFMCIVEHPAIAGGSNITTIVLNVTYPPDRPNIQVTNNNKKLACTAEANPPANFIWLMPSSAPTSTFSGSTVALVKPEDPERQNDTYTCVASNGIEPSSEETITTAEASAYVAIVKSSNTGVIVAAVVGSILLVVIIVALVYWFVIRKMREKDEGPYNPKRISRHGDESGGSNWQRSSGRPIIEHANESLNKNAPPSPKQPPPAYEEEEVGSDGSRSDVEEDMDGHDVDLTAPLTQNDDDMPTAGIVSKNSVNFQPYWRTSIATEHRRQRPSTSPHRRSQNRGYPEPTPRSMPEPEPNYDGLQQRTDPRYEVPPMEYYDDEEYGDEEPLEGHLSEEPIDNRFYDRPEDRYPDYQQRYKQPQSDIDPPYTKDIQYASIDHGYNGREPRTRPPYHEPVEYAEIRSHGQIV